MNVSLVRIAKGVAGALVLIVLFSVVSRWYGDYRDTVKASPNETTTTAPPAGESASETATAVPQGAKTLIVLTDGLNFRDQPSREGKKIRGLKKNESLTLIKSQPGWYNVQDRAGQRGWISSSKSYTKIAE